MFIGFVQVHGNLLPALTPPFRAKALAAFEQGGLMQPAAQVRVMAKKGCFPREDDENGLRDFFSGRRIAKLAAGCSVNERGMPIHQRGERLFQTAPGVFTKQILITPFVHSQIKLPPIAKSRNIFSTQSQTNAVENVGMALRAWAKWGG